MMGNNVSAIHSQLLVPFAGVRDNDAGEVYVLGSFDGLRSSSPDSTEHPNSRFLYLDVDGQIDMVRFSRADAFSLRCIYDSYETYTPA